MAPEIIIAELAEPSDALAEVPFGAPRRFGVGTILIVTAAFAGLLGLLRWFGAPPLVVGFLVGLVSLVGLGQAVLFRGHQPRQASIVTGIACFAVSAAVVFTRELIRGPVSTESAVVLLTGISFWAIAFGPVCGYLAGCFVAAVFLVMAAVDRLLGRLRAKPTPAEAGEAP